MWTRRTALLGAVALGACAPRASADLAPISPLPTSDARLQAIEARVGGRVGVAAWNTGTNAWLVHRADERFAMCSMFKWLLAAQMLWIDEHNAGFREEPMRFNAADIVGHSPVVQANLARGVMSVEELCRAALVESDNAAANLLLVPAMGPAGFTRFLSENADPITRLDRTEPSLNENLPGDERDTTTPRAMAQTMQHFLLTDAVLNASSRETLTNWLMECRTGLRRLRGGFPNDWRAGDKTGTSVDGHNATTDVAIAWPPGKAPIIVACFLSDSIVGLDARNAAHAEVGRMVAADWG